MNPAKLLLVEDHTQDKILALCARPKSCYLPVVVSTSSDDEQHGVDSYRCGCNSFDHEPTDCTDYSEILAGVGRYWATTNETPRTV